MISLCVFDTDMPRVAFFAPKTKTGSDFLLGGIQRPFLKKLDFSLSFHAFMIKS